MKVIRLGWFKAVVLKFNVHVGHLEGLLNLLGPAHRVSDLVGLGQGLKICISRKFLGGTYAAGLGIILWEQRTASLN